MNRDTRAAWLSNYEGFIDQAYDTVVKLLTSDWMMPDQTGDRCSHELTRVRQTYVPELILRLHVMLYILESMSQSRHVFVCRSSNASWTGI
ncbi:hypothetical protein EV702DRAFT_1140296 [Suillus placidus]|uniref:Nuclear pore complex protein n=1 Tax=Suillus placidus TaxID=48579 RepID=A0A9P6ZKD5_9AGAM|nr:hypothetical protein EV702DRAFT_1140296 [Suillus placidus]